VGGAAGGIRPQQRVVGEDVMSTMTTSIALGWIAIASVACSSEYAKGAEPCDPQVIAKADVGYACVVKTASGSVSWRVEAVLSGTRKFRVVKDLKSGLYVSDDMGKHPHDPAVKQNLCQSPAYSNQRGNLTSVTWRMPSGYPRALNGKNGFPNRDSDFVILEDDGMREVVPGLANKVFTSSSESSDPTEDGAGAYAYDGDFGGLDTSCDFNGNTSLRCVGQ
jgi:hypothetical protein